MMVGGLANVQGRALTLPQSTRHQKAVTTKTANFLRRSHPDLPHSTPIWHRWNTSLIVTWLQESGTRQKWKFMMVVLLPFWVVLRMQIWNCGFVHSVSCDVFVFIESFFVMAFCLIPVPCHEKYMSRKNSVDLCRLLYYPSGIIQLMTWESVWNNPYFMEWRFVSFHSSHGLDVKEF